MLQISFKNFSSYLAAQQKQNHDKEWKMKVEGTTQDN